MPDWPTAKLMVHFHRCAFAALAALLMVNVADTQASSEGSWDTDLGSAEIVEANATTGEAEQVRMPKDWTGLKSLIREKFPEAPQLSVDELSQMFATPEQPLLIDVREPEEYAVSHLPGAINAQGSELDALLTSLGPDQKAVLYCSVGYRSSRETERLQRKGFTDLANLEGSIFEWANTGHPMTSGAPDTEKQTSFVHPFDDAWGTFLDAERHSYTPR